MLDVDSDNVDLLRKLGLKVFYGDASRYDLLQAAGAEGDSAARYSMFVAPRQGMSQLVEALAARLPAGCLRTGSAAESPGGWG